MHRARAAIVASLFVAAFESFAWAQATPPVRLHYEIGAGAERCPGESALTDAVSARLGYAPFSAEADRAIVVKIDRVGKGLRATIDRVDEHGQIVGTRVVESPTTACSELASSVALAVSIAVDPLRASGLPPAPRSPPAAVAPPALPRPPLANEPVAASEHDSEHRPLHAVEPKGPSWRVGAAAGLVTGLGASPALSVGAAAEVRVRHGAFSVGLEGRDDFPASGAAVGSAHVRSSLLLGGVIPCGHQGAFFVCAVFAIGVLEGTAWNVAVPEHPSTVYAHAGARVGAELPLGKTFAARMNADVLATLTPTSLRIDAHDVWTTSPVSGVLSLSLAAYFP